jgi:hypothetical protein
MTVDTGNGNSQVLVVNPNGSVEGKLPTTNNGVSYYAAMDNSTPVDPYPTTPERPGQGENSAAR